MKAVNWINKIVVSLALLTSVSALAETQTAPSSGLRVNPVIGATSFNLTGYESENEYDSGTGSAKSGSMIGALVEYQLEWLDSSIETGLVYLETGSQADYFFGAVETTISYLVIPINWKAPIGSMANVPLHFKAGLLPSFLMGAEQTGTGFSAGLGTTDIKDQFNTFDFMAQVGIGGEYVIDERFAVQMDAAYVRGFNEVHKDNGGINQGLSLTAALAISI